LIALLCAGLAVGGFYAFWRYFWFFRDPPRTPPPHDGLVSPADGTVVYVKRVKPGEPVVVIKQGVPATVRDILREDFEREKVVIGIFMSPFDIHYNRAPFDATVGFVKRHPASGAGGNAFMTEMHWRTLFDARPLHANSIHIVQNERVVTQFEGRYRDEPLACYVVQIGARTVNGIDTYFAPGEAVARGATFGMIRVGSQVDLVVPWREGFEVLVKEGERVRAGETLLLR
jgi:phosphatidylserine decarboxylase